MPAVVMRAHARHGFNGDADEAGAEGTVRRPATRRSGGGCCRFVPLPPLENWPVVRVEPAASRRFVTSLAVAGCGLAPEARSVGLTLADSEGAVRLALAARGTTLDHDDAAESMLRHAGPVAVPVRAQPANGGSASQVVTLPVGRSGEPG